MDIKMLSVEEWNSHPAVEVSFLGNKKDTPIFRLEAGWYHGGLGFPILSDGSVCVDAFQFLHSSKYIQFFKTIKSIELPRPDTTKCIEVMQRNDCFIFYGGLTYYHFVVDYLGTFRMPALSSVLENRGFVIRKNLPTKYKEFLLEILKVHGCVAPNFIPTDFVLFPFKDSFIPAHPSNAEKIGNIRRLASKIDVAPIPDLSRIFVLRGSTQRRNLLNEQELASMLVKDFGFSVINPGKFSIKDQIRCFKNANIIVGGHGGGLTNALFADNLQVLIEIFHSNTRSFFSRISNQLGAKHFYLKVDPVESLDRQGIHFEDDKNMNINLQSAKKFFRLLFAGKLDSLVASQACLIDLTSAK